MSQVTYRLVCRFVGKVHPTKQKSFVYSGLVYLTGGEGGIRTHDPVARIPVFETGTFNHSATSPAARILAGC
jgi:hypothetical protein